MAKERHKQKMEENGNKLVSRKHFLESILKEIYNRAKNVRWSKDDLHYEIRVESGFFDQPTSDETKFKNYCKLFELTFCSPLAEFQKINRKPFSREIAVKNAIRYLKTNNIEMPESLLLSSNKDELAILIYEVLSGYLAPVIFQVSVDKKQGEKEWGSADIAEDFANACSRASLHCCGRETIYTALNYQESSTEKVYDSSCLDSKCRHGLWVKVKEKLPEVIWDVPVAFVWKRKMNTLQNTSVGTEIQTYEKIVSHFFTADEIEIVEKVKSSVNHSDNSTMPLLGAYPITDKIVSLEQFGAYEFFYFTDLSQEWWREKYSHVKNMKELDSILRRRIKEEIKKRYSANQCEYYKSVIASIEDVLKRTLSNALTLKRLINRSNKQMSICEQILSDFSLDPALIMYHLSYISSKQDRIMEAYNIIEKAIYTFADQLKLKGKMLAHEMHKYLDDKEIMLHRGEIYKYYHSALLTKAIQTQNMDVLRYPDQYIDEIKDISDYKRYSKLFELLKNALKEYHEYLSESLDVDNLDWYSECVGCSKCQRCPECPMCPLIFETNYLERSGSISKLGDRTIDVIPKSPAN